MILNFYIASGRSEHNLYFLPFPCTPPVPSVHSAPARDSYVLAHARKGGTPTALRTSVTAALMRVSRHGINFYQRINRLPSLKLEIWN